MQQTFEACVGAHHQGRITLGEFFRETKPVFERVAAKLLKRWTPSGAVDVEDVVQEMRIGSIWAFKRYDPTRPGAASLESYVMYNACDKAKKWLHKQRGANRHGNADAALPRYAVLFHDVAARRGRREEGDEVEIEWLSEELQTKPDQDLAIERKQTWRWILQTVPTVRLRWGVMALESARGDKDAAAQTLYEHDELRLKLRLGSMREARKVVGQAMRYFEIADVALEGAAA